MVGSTTFSGNSLNSSKENYSQNRGLFMGKGFELAKPVIGDILTSQKPYIVPAYQRDYSWDKDEVEDFWKDLIKCKEQKSYFFGSMVFKAEKEDKNITIIDGQQRLATITILLSAIRDLLFENDAKKDYLRINEHYIIKEYEGETEVKTLTLNLINREYFYYCIQLLPDDKNKKKFTDYPKTEKTNKLIRNAYEFFKGELSKLISAKSSKEKIQLLNELVTHIRTTLTVITITVDTEEEAYLIFETINDRGLELSVADLFKNYLIRKAKSEEDRQEIISMWKVVSTLLDDKLRAFLRHYWVSKKGEITERKLFGELTKHIETDKIDVKNFVKEIKDEATNYNSIYNPEDGSWQDKEITNLILEFNILSAKQCLPLLMSGLKMFDEKEFKNLLKSITNFTFRYSTICNKHNNILEAKYSDTAIQIRNGGIKDTQQAMKNLKSIYPEDDEFIKSFSNKSADGKLARYILTKIEEKNAKYPAEKPNYKTCNLEHILPQSPDKEWKKYFKEKKVEDEEIEEITYKIGNLTLLDVDMNRQAKNLFFTKKRDQYYKKSILWLNEPIKSIKEWNKKVIESRQEALAKLANKIWEIKF